uniref:Zinc finger PMZ-type domain-containing protein n=1 Tax=Tanacetum cinerariifolium TaxID=118510 RepID=A0A6L2JS28_TANCI|nr:hypothetical protein [Tanacetum cinerariifolium]
MSSPNHPTSDIENTFSSNSPDYTPVSPDYFPALSRNTSYGLVPIALASAAIFVKMGVLQLANGFSLWSDKSTSKKVIAKCGKRKEVIKDANIGKQRAFKNSFVMMRNQLVDYKWIGRNFGDKIKANPQITIDVIVELVMKKYKCIVSHTQCRHAKSFALNEGDAAIQYHYGYLRSYTMALANSNEGTTVKLGVTVNPDEKTYFDRFYVCFQAVGRDGNNHIFPVAWAVVTVENKDNWSWFLDLLADDLEDSESNLVELNSESCFWAASKAIYPQLFQKIMENIKRANPKAHDYLMKKDPKTWSKTYFNEGMCCKAVKNGFCECFNSVLVSVRHKPIITMLESMRVIIMERMNSMIHLMENGMVKYVRIKKILELEKDQQRFWHVIPFSGNLFEVRKGSEAFRVDEPKRTCSCRMWQLSGFLYCHAIACIFRLNRMVEGYVPQCFMKDRPKKKRIRALHEPKLLGDLECVFVLPLVSDEEDAIRMVRDEELLSKVVEVESSLNEDSFKRSMLRTVSNVGRGILKRMILSVGVGGGGGGLSSTAIVVDFVIRV